ncbi:hypothetical protein DFH07DRAFT_1006145 [Mycena maculata]|uniref:Uncharacterized protein n=1 Tax=Mycena maculata TaxID=230809 RepID=A0AAD7MMJ1_9AGAR|nr:hypothetical protein DFH07DRAFT_1006145 [Mycena maculata]
MRSHDIKAKLWLLTSCFLPPSSLQYTASRNPPPPYYGSLQPELTLVLPPPYIESTPPQLQPLAASSSLKCPLPLHVTLPDASAHDDRAAHNIKVINRELTKKRKRDDPATRSLQSQGRGIRKVAAMFGEISTILANAEEYAKHPYPDDDDEDEDDLDKTEPSEEDEKLSEMKRRQVTNFYCISCGLPLYSAERNLGAALEIKRLVPNLKQMVAKYKEKDDLSPLVHYFTALQKGANDARSDDFKQVTIVIGNLINQDRDRPELLVFDHTPLIKETRQQEEGTEVEVLIKQKAPILNPSSWSTRGIEHDITGGLLSTIDLDWSDPKRVVFLCCLIPWLTHILPSSFRVRAGLRGQTLHLGGNYWARIFYDKFQGNKQHVEDGFLKSRYLVKGYMVIFTAPSSADAEEDENTPPAKRPSRTTKPVRKTVADIVGMNGKVSPLSLAYVVIIVYLSLTTATQWTTEYYGVSMVQLYDFIVDFFEGPKPGSVAKARTDALLAWWNKKIFPSHAASAATHQTTVNSRAMLKAQHRAMEAETVL